MLFSLEVLQAQEGDCMILHWGDDHAIALIDGGPSGVWGDTLKDRLEVIRQAREDATDNPTLTFALVMVSHVDSDHIIGVTELFAVLRNTIGDARPPFRVDRLWHNTFADILGQPIDPEPEDPTEDILASTSGAGWDPEVFAAVAAGEEGERDLTPKDAVDLGLILAGHGEGRQLRDDYKLLKEKGLIHRLNSPFASAVEYSPNRGRIPLGELSIRVVAPSQAELVKLRADFDLYLKKQGLAGPAALAALAALSRKDTSPSNLSSIVCLLEYPEIGEPPEDAVVRRILLTGDARGDKIVKALTEAGELGAGGFLELDILKVPHHGSSANASRAFFDALRAKTYVFSGNGAYENPDRETIQWLIDSRAPGDDYCLLFTYPVDVIDAKRKKVREGKHEPWHPDDDPIGKLLDEKRAAGHKFKICEGPRILNLGDETVSF